MFACVKGELLLVAASPRSVVLVGSFMVHVFEPDVDCHLTNSPSSLAFSPQGRQNLILTYKRPDTKINLRSRRRSAKLVNRGAGSKRHTQNI